MSGKNIRLTGSTLSLTSTELKLQPRTTSFGKLEPAITSNDTRFFEFVSILRTRNPPESVAPYNANGRDVSYRTLKLKGTDNA